MSDLNLIPMPATIKNLPGDFDTQLISSIILKNNSKKEKNCAKLFQSYLRPIGDISISSTKESQENQLIIELGRYSQIETEGYSLLIGKDNAIYLRASTASGLFYGFQTFRQLCGMSLENGVKPEKTTIPNCEIRDAPRFAYRGMHLDVSRHFFDVGFVRDVYVF